VVAANWQPAVRNGLETVALATPAAGCTVALAGAQVLSFQPARAGADGGGRDWLWVSDKARWQVGSALRGGIPICFPWFGPHPAEPSFPAHGFARTRLWQLAGVDEIAGDRWRAVFDLHADAETSALFPHAFRARHTVIAGQDLELSFEVANEGADPFAFEVALHTYFAVSDLDAVTIEGLAGRGYVDKVAGGQRRRQGDAPFRFDGEIDRVYQGGGPVTLIDTARPTPLQIDSQGAGSTVVWNPGAAKARALGDLDPDGFRHFVCIETGNVGNQKITLSPGARHLLSVRYRAA
jgi:glucose-6-phosphate 1-epimerase